MNHKIGFTLLELIMVLIIIVMTGLIIVPRMVSFLNTWDLNTEARKLRADIREVQQSAITKQKRYRIEFNLDAESYDIKYDTGGGSFTLLENVKLKNNIEIDSTTFTNPASDTVDFYHFGNPSQAGSIVLKDTVGHTCTVSIASATGKADIQ